MKEKIRNSGINTLGGLPWGTHFCQFYQAEEDLIDILVPYFKAGLENNEFCMWITSEPLGIDGAKQSLKRAVTNLDGYFKNGQIEILDYGQWYTQSGSFDGNRVLGGWVEKEKHAFKKGFDGLRLTGNTSWLEKKDWKNFTDYEASINNVIWEHRMLAICSYPIYKCGVVEALDVTRNHQFSIIRRNKEWEQIDNSKLRRAIVNLEEVATDWQSTFNSTEDLIMLLDNECKIIRANHSTSKYLGMDINKILGKTCYQLFHPTKNPPEDCPFEKIKQTKRHEETELYLEEKDIWLDVSCDPIFDNEGNLDGAVHIIKDITTRKDLEEQLNASLEEKELLLKEIHHRVKNNMQIMSSLLNLQISSIKSKKLQEMLKQYQNRIRTMALVHEMLYQSKDLSRINLGQYMKSLAVYLYKAYNIDYNIVRLKTDIKDVSLDIKNAIPCGLIINELISNSLEHAFPEGKKGEIRLKLYVNKGGKRVIIVSDNGIGLPKGLYFRKTDTLGLRLVNELIEQLRGTIELDRKGGTKFKITF